MDYSEFSNFEDLFKACGYTNLNNSNNKCKNSNSKCCDIPNGFQTLNPELFVAISGVLGEIISGSVPFNVQNALGNWFELLGQVILTYNAQQQYFQSGPGKCYDPKNYNINNQLCNTSQSSNSQNNKNSSSEKKLDELETLVKDLSAEIKIIKDKIQDL